MATMTNLVCPGGSRVAGLPWIEIDFPSDLLLAERTILPRLSRAATEDEEADTDVA